MFTGIVEEVGTVASVEPAGDGVVLRIAAERVTEGMKLGDSVAVDGACQTVTAFDARGFTVQAVGTTLQRTTFGGFAPGRRVNLERAMALGDRLGGHLVQGHVDGVGRTVSVERLEERVLIRFTLPDEVARTTVLHGSITMDGISLTVNDLPDPGVCEVSIVPHTWEHTRLPDLRVGDPVNVEGDLIGKFVRRLLEAPAAGEGGAPGAAHLRRAWGYPTGS